MNSNLTTSFEWLFSSPQGRCVSGMDCFKSTTTVRGKKKLFETKKYYRYWWEAKAARLLCCLNVLFPGIRLFLLFTFHVTVDIRLGRRVSNQFLYVDALFFRSVLHFSSLRSRIVFSHTKMPFLITSPIDLILWNQYNILKTYISVLSHILYSIQIVGNYVCDLTQRLKIFSPNLFPILRWNARMFGQNNL